MSLGEFIGKLITENGVTVLLLLLTLVEITPIKVNPLGVFFKWLGKMINGELHEKIDKLKREFEQKNANDMRWNILNFANECRNERRHSREEWEHVIDQLKCYETYVKEHHIDNGVIEEETKYLRELYHEVCRENDFY